VSKDEIIAEKEQELLEKNAEIKSLKLRLSQLEKMFFGSRSERRISVDSSEDQLRLFEEATTCSEVTEQEAEQITYNSTKSKKKHLGRNAFPSHLPVQEIIIEPENLEEGSIKIREEITETLEYTPANLFIKRIIRPVYAKPDGQGITIAELPARPLPKAIAEARLLSYILISKFVDHLPFYRQIKRFKREFDWEVSSSTINDWFVGCAVLLEPLYNMGDEMIF